MRNLFKNKGYSPLLLAIVLGAFFLRFYQLGSVPDGLTNDEANTGYDAYSLVQTGRDQWNQFLPITNFKGFGDYRLPVYTYIVAPFIKIFGLSAFSVRIPSALFGIFSVVLIYFLAKKLFGGKIGILSAFFLAISPWSIGLSRVGVESNISISFLLLGLNLFFRLKDNSKYIVISSLFFALAMITYTSYIIFIPLLIVTLYIFFWHDVMVHKKLLLLSFLIIGLALFILFGQGKSTAGVRSSQVGILSNIDSIGLLANLNDQRGRCKIEFPEFFCKIANNKITLFTSRFIQNYISHFSLDYIYIRGNPTQFSTLPARGLGYTFGALLFPIGIYVLLSKTKKKALLFLTVTLLAPVADSLTGTGHYSRASILLPFLTILEASGFYFILKLISSIKIGIMRSITLISVCLFIFYSCFSFVLIYFTYFRDSYSLYTNYSYKELATVIHSQKDQYDEIYISSQGNDTKQYIYYLFYEQYDPKKFQRKINVSYTQDSNGWVSISKIDNIHFVPNLQFISNQSNLLHNKILLISHPKGFPKTIIPQRIIKDRLGNTVFMVVPLSDLSKHTDFIKKGEDLIQ